MWNCVPKIASTGFYLHAAKHLSLLVIQAAARRGCSFPLGRSPVHHSLTWRPHMEPTWIQAMVYGLIAGKKLKS